MPQWLVIAMMVSQLLPLIQQAVQWVESIASGQPGVFKKEQALAFLKAILQGTAPFSKLDAGTIDALLAIASPLIDMVVAIFNATGVFKKSS
jgi:hypothetical protein